GSVVSWVFAVNAAKERDIARQQKRRVREALDSMVSREMIERLGTQKKLTPGQREFLQKALGYYREFAAETETEEEGRELEANAHFRVAYLLGSLGQHSESVTAYRAALAIQEKLAADYPRVPIYRQQLARSHNNLGSELDELGQQ